MIGKHPSRNSESDAHLVANEQTAIAEAISVPQVDQPEAHSTPKNIGPAHHEVEYDELAREQLHQFDARGEREAREDTVCAAGLEPRKVVAEQVIDEARRNVEEARAHRTLARAVLLGLTRRSPHAALKYWFTYLMLFGGDVAGVAGAAVLLGEIPYLAVMQAVSSAAAAVTAGFIGHDIAVVRHARRRQKDAKELTAEQTKFAYLFTGADSGERIVQRMVLLAATIALLVVGAIFALRSSVEGVLGGLVFGCLAGAIATASALNAYHFADEISDILDHADLLVKRALKQFEKASTNPALSKFHEASTRAASIKAEHTSSGLAAARKILALKHAISRLNPQIMGHGRASASQQMVLFPETSLEDALPMSNSLNGHHS
jgi:hypothetical protein